MRSMRSICNDLYYLAVLCRVYVSAVMSVSCLHAVHPLFYCCDNCNLFYLMLLCLLVASNIITNQLIDNVDLMNRCDNFV